MIDRNQQVLTLVNASRNNDVEGIMKGLTELNIRKASNPLKDIFGKFKYLGQSMLGNKGDNAEDEEIMLDLLIKAVKHNNVDLCKYLIESKELRINVDLNHNTLWVHCLITGNLDAINVLINTPKLSNKNKANLILRGLEYYVSKVSNLEMLKYLLDDPKMPLHDDVVRELKKKCPEVSVLTRFNIFINACSINNREWVDFLLEHKEYSKMINPLGFGMGIEAACSNGELELMDYLLNDKKMPYKQYIDYDPSNLLKIAISQCEIDILQHLIFNCNIKKPDNLDEFLKEEYVAVSYSSFVRTLHSQDDIQKTVKFTKEMFEKRELMENLGANLDVNPTANKPKRKI